MIVAHTSWRRREAVGDQAFLGHEKLSGRNRQGLEAFSRPMVGGFASRSV